MTAVLSRDGGTKLGKTKASGPVAGVARLWARWLWLWLWRSGGLRHGPGKREMGEGDNMPVVVLYKEHGQRQREAGGKPCVIG